MPPDTTSAPDRWLSPSAALQRFRPPAGTAIGVRPATTVRRTRFGFRIGHLGLLIKPGTLSEVVLPLPIRPMPNVPAWFLGVMNLRGNLLPVFDVHRLLETDPSTPGKRAVLILDQGSRMLGIPLDSLPQAVAFDGARRTVPPLPEVLQEHVSAVYTVDGALWGDFDHHSFFTTLGRQLAR